MGNEIKVAYDVMSSLDIRDRDGKNLTLEFIFNYYRTHWILLYNSLRGDAPTVISGDVVLKDVNGEVNNEDGKS